MQKTTGCPINNITQLYFETPCMTFILTNEITNQTLSNFMIIIYHQIWSIYMEPNIEVCYQYVDCVCDDLCSSMNYYCHVTVKTLDPLCFCSPQTRYLESMLWVQFTSIRIVAYCNKQESLYTTLMCVLDELRHGSDVISPRYYRPYS